MVVVVGGGPLLVSAADWSLGWRGVSRGFTRVSWVGSSHWMTHARGAEFKPIKVYYQATPTRH